MELYLTPFMVIETIILIVITIGNSFIIFLNIKNGFFKSRVFYLVTSQAIADLCTALIVIPSEIILTDKNIFQHVSHIPCLFILSSFLAILSVSQLSVLNFSLDRLLAVKFPHYYHPRKKENPRVFLIACWILGLASGFVVLIWNRGIERKCSVGVDSKLTKNYICFRHTLFIIFPVIGLIIIFILIISKFKEMRARLNAHAQNNLAPVVQTRGQVLEASITNSFLIIISLFIFCWIPRTVYHIKDFQCDHCIDRDYENMSKIVFIVSHIPPMINPIIYGVRMEKIQNAIKETFESAFS